MTREHGTRARYIKGPDRNGQPGPCRCTRCRAANAAYEARRGLRKAEGVWEPYVDALPAREHVEDLGRIGLKPKRVAELAGLDPRIVVRLVQGVPHRGVPPSRRVRARTARAILAVQADPAALKACARVDGTGTRRRLQALIAMGWSQRKLAALSGIHRSNLVLIVRADSVRADTARKVEAVYDRFWDVPPPQATAKDRAATAKAREWARREGWPSPLAWDDDTIGDPAALPDLGVKVSRLAALSEDCEELLRQGLTLDLVAGRLGVTRKYLDQVRHRTRKAAA